MTRARETYRRWSRSVNDRVRINFRNAARRQGRAQGLQPRPLHYTMLPGYNLHREIRWRYNAPAYRRMMRKRIAGRLLRAAMRRRAVVNEAKRNYINARFRKRAKGKWQNYKYTG